MNDYQKQAIDFLAKTNSTITFEYLKTDFHFEDDKFKRDIYLITIKRGERSFTFEFGNSLMSSGKYWKHGNYKNGITSDNKAYFICDWEKNKSFSPPNEYSILSCLTKYDPGTLENFCSDYGYDTDSISASKVYKAVINEWYNVAMLWSDDEIDELREEIN